MQKPNTDWGFPWSVFFVIMMRIFDCESYIRAMFEGLISHSE